MGDAYSATVALELRARHTHPGKGDEGEGGKKLGKRGPVIKQSAVDSLEGVKGSCSYHAGKGGHRGEAPAGSERILAKSRVGPTKATSMPRREDIAAHVPTGGVGSGDSRDRVEKRGGQQL